MKVGILNHTPNADRTVIACARGDYLEDSLVGLDLGNDDEFAELMEGTEVDGEKEFVERLIRRGHFGPTEHASITFAIEGLSRTGMAQITRHRHATFDVQSMRYVGFDDAEMLMPASFQQPVEALDATGEMDYADVGYFAQEHMDRSLDLYNDMVEEGVPEEDARMVLPLGTKVNMSATFNLRSLMHVLDLRENAKAQDEARELATKMHELAHEVAPYTIEAYETHCNNNSLRAP